MQIDCLTFEVSQDKPVDYFNLFCNFEEQGYNGKFDYNMFTGKLKIIGHTYNEDMEYENSTEIGEICFHAYNLNKFGFDYFCDNFAEASFNRSLYYAMDMESRKTEFHFAIFEKGYQQAFNAIPLNEWNDMSFYESNCYLITVDWFYINPKYRRQGVATYILKNFFKIFYTCLNIVPLFVVGLSLPGDNETQKMQEIQNRLLSSTGFNVFKLSNESVFCKCIYDIEFIHNIQM